MAEINNRKWQKWMPKVIDAWCGSRNVQALSDAAYRAYDHLLMAQWQSEDGMLPADDKSLAKASAMFGRWPEVKDEVLEMFKREGKRIYSPRQLEEWRRAEAVYQKKRQGGKSKQAKICADNKGTSEESSVSAAGVHPGVHYTVTETVTVTETEVLKKDSRPIAPLAGKPAPTPNLAREAVGRAFTFYCLKLGRDERKYTLTPARRDKAVSRYQERLKIHLGDHAKAEMDLGTAIDHLSQDNFLVEGGWIDWIDHIFKSTEAFEKRLTPPRNGGNNGRNQHKTAGNLGALDQVLKFIEQSDQATDDRQSGLEVCVSPQRSRTA